MRAVVQRTDRSSVTVDGAVIANAGCGLTVLLGVAGDDTEEDARYLTEKIVNLRIFPDNEGKMNLSLIDSKGELLVVSQFTLYGDCRKGRRPSFDQAAKPDKAKELYEVFIRLCREAGIAVSQGQFQTHMIVALDNNGPVTMLLDSKRQF
ncbi:D-aminoacyl-tRNA deacylase [Anaerospora sp.]|jgi:D-tyrosyl-tRNA(Tyr) deacylase|uniref:D-aminoacyl-tRNA deacylase n=1 Tax=Anaerospora sp. TaxID=1960278 RepID=UPI00289C5435|nr:D-aminoacyl-tRNA deacylase [Anaerospora sp.]